MNGEVGVESLEGKGSEFWFTARLARQTTARPQESLHLANLRGVRVLIVDDNATSRKILTARLSSWEMFPSACANAIDALHVLQQACGDHDPFRIAVIDMQMPGMDGETLGRLIKADKRLADTRMVMLTSLGMRGDARRFHQAGFSAYANKPIRHQELKAVLSLTLADQNDDEPTRQAGSRDRDSEPAAKGWHGSPGPIITRHTAREMQNRFAFRQSRILLAEDNITNQQVALGILKKFGLRADTVSNGTEAIKALEAIPYDLVLMDVQMPLMDGTEVTRIIRGWNLKSGNDDAHSVSDIKERASRIPIIAMTAHAIQGDREHCIEAGMNDYITKPVSPRALMEALEKWLPKEESDNLKPAAEETPTMISSRQLQIPVFDRAGMMARLMDDEILAKKIIAAFLEDTPRQIAVLKKYLDAGDSAGLERQAHSIKGAAANVGGEALRAVVFAMEIAAKIGNLAAVNACMTELDMQFDALRSEIQTWQGS